MHFIDHILGIEFTIDFLVGPRLRSFTASGSSVRPGRFPLLTAQPI